MTAFSVLSMVDTTVVFRLLEPCCNNHGEKRLNFIPNSNNTAPLVTYTDVSFGPVKNNGIGIQFQHDGYPKYCYENPPVVYYVPSLKTDTYNQWRAQGWDGVSNRVIKS